MMTANLVIEKLTRDGWRKVFERRNSPTAAGFTGIRNRMISDTAALGASSHMFAGTLDLGGMDTGYPQHASAQTEVVFRTTYTNSGAQRPLGDNIGLRPSSGAGNNWLQVAGTALNPIVINLAAGSTYRFTWTLSFRLQMALNMENVVNITQRDPSLPEDAPLDDVATSGMRLILNRITGITNQASLDSCRLQFWGLTPHPPGPDQLTPAEVALNDFELGDLTQVGSDIPVTLGAEGDRGFVTAPFTIPAIEQADTTVATRNRWWVLVSGPNTPGIPLGGWTFPLHRTAHCACCWAWGWCDNGRHQTSRHTRARGRREAEGAGARGRS